MTDYNALIALATENQNDERLGGLIGDLAEALKSSIEARAIDEGKMAAQADDLKDRIAATERERDEAHAILAAADKGTPIYSAVERILDEHSAWIARPSPDVTKAIALAAGVVWMAAEKVCPDLEEMDRALSEARTALAAAQAEVEKLREAQSPAERDVLVERRRQIDVEGWSPMHDDTHDLGELAKAASCYAVGVAWRWPWNELSWKPGNRRRDLVKAGALIIAEIERLDRAALAQGGRDDG